MSKLFQCVAAIVDDAAVGYHFGIKKMDAEAFHENPISPGGDPGHRAQDHFSLNGDVSEGPHRKKGRLSLSLLGVFFLGFGRRRRRLAVFAIRQFAVFQEVFDFFGGDRFLFKERISASRMTSSLWFGQNAMGFLVGLIDDLADLGVDFIGNLQGENLFGPKYSPRPRKTEELSFSYGSAPVDIPYSVTINRAYSGWPLRCRFGPRWKCTEEENYLPRNGRRGNR
jgi:hypothetical protein